MDRSSSYTSHDRDFSAASQPVCEQGATRASLGSRTDSAEAAAADGPNGGNLSLGGAPVDGLPDAPTSSDLEEEALRMFAGHLATIRDLARLGVTRELHMIGSALFSALGVNSRAGLYGIYERLYAAHSREAKACAWSKAKLHVHQGGSFMDEACALCAAKLYEMAEARR